jgi:hypothetical protein
MHKKIKQKNVLRREEIAVTAGNPSQEKKRK